MHARTRLALALFPLAPVFLWIGAARAEDGRFTPRFREHYDFTQLHTPAGHENYGGLSSSVNLFYEKPLEWSFGLVFNPVVPGRQKQFSPANPLLPAKIRNWTWGVEYQHFLLAEPGKHGLFARVGAAFNVLDNKGVANQYGGSYYLGLGWEHRVWDIGFAPEIAFRHVIFEKSTQAYQFTPSLALRLYFVNEWLEGLMQNGTKKESR